MKWVTREKAKVDRVACPWLISRFVDPAPEFLFVPKDEVLRVADREGATPFDTPGAELTHFRHEGKEFVSFDAILQKYGLTDPALFEMARIVRTADTRLPDPAPEGAGLEAAAIGFRELAKDDHENLRLQFPLYDALLLYCRGKIERGDTLEHSGPSAARP